MIKKRVMIVQSKNQTKTWRLAQTWYKTGTSNECEIYQRSLIEGITKKQCPKTNMRLNLRTLDLVENSRPLKKSDGFDWSEDFDGGQQNDGSILYYNLKMICDSGGAQTRSLREVYHFVEAQLKYLLRNPDISIYFINILDGDTCYGQKEKFQYLTNLPEYESIRHRVFVDDMFMYQYWYQSNFSMCLSEDQVIDNQ
jgi:hypothetical protein